MPVSGTFSSFLAYLLLNFDRPLQPGPIDPLNWQLRYNSTLWNGVGINAGLPAAHHVSGTFTNTGIPQPPGTFLYYLPPPFDVVSTFGKPAAAFADFPITVI